MKKKVGGRGYRFGGGGGVPGRGVAVELMEGAVAAT